MQKLVICRGVFNVILLAILFSIGYNLMKREPFRRGFHCNDDTIRYPFKPEDTVDFHDLLLLVLLLPVVVIVVSELCVYIVSVKRLPLADVHFTTETLSILSDWFLATCISFILESFMKVMCGRLRPMFMEACRPNVTCSGPDDNRYITEYECTDEKYPLDDLGKSFPSGHSSESMLAMSYLALYFHKRYKKVFLLRYVVIALQLLFIMIALFTALSRIQDYRHHWSDVLAGLALGASVAIFSAKLTGKLDNLRHYELRREIEINTRVKEMISI